MPDFARYALHRPEIEDALSRGEDKVARLMARNSRAVPAGTTLIKADAEHNHVYRLRKGWVARVRRLPDGRSQFILIFLPGDLFAVKSMYITHHTDGVEVLSDSVVEQVDARELRGMCERDPDVALRCSWQLVEEERRLHNWTVGLGRGNAEERIALLLTDFRGRLAASGTIPEDAQEYELPMTQEQLGDHLGLSTVHVNRVLKLLREGGVVTIRERTVRIGELTALVHLAYPLLDLHERTAPEFGGLLQRGGSGS